MSALVRPNLHIKPMRRLQESVLVKKQRTEKKKLEESKELRDRIDPENEEYSDPHEGRESS